MNWFSNQIEERQRSDQQLLEDSFEKVAGVVLGKRTAEKIVDERIVAKSAIDEILKHYHYKPVEIPGEIKNVEEQLDYCLTPHGLMSRMVELTEGWYKNAYGPILAFTKEDGLATALLPGPISGYYYNDPKTERRVRLNSKTAAGFERDAVCFYRPLPQKKLGIPDLLSYMRHCMAGKDIVLILALTLVVASVGLILPIITRALTGPVLNSGKTGALIGVAICFVCVTLSSNLFGSVKTLSENRLETKVSLGVQASMMMRLLSLPAEFFRKYSPGEMKSRSMSVNQLCSMLMKLAVNITLCLLTSVLYITQIFRMTPTLAVPAIIIVLITAGFFVITTVVQTRISRKHMELAAKESGVSYSLISSVQKIKLAGAEKRMFAKWLNLYADDAELTYNPPTILKIKPIITTAITLISTIVLYYLAVKNNISQSDYYAFTTAYGMLMGTFMSVTDIAQTTAQIKPVLEIAEPFLNTEPESSDYKEIVTHISGRIELDHVSFRYDKTGPFVLDDLSIRFKPGEYVAVVGRTGCGKSTLVRLLLGFEKPEKGAIYYDGRDIESMNLPSLRRKIGTVMQDAGLFQGDIYSNIVITAPELTLDDAWEAAETADIADDIRAMPMGMQTFVTEGQGGISGGQRQRIMIARAVAPKPKLLIFDEATSALDNKSQRQVSEALDAMGCTRIVIAHRLSTIRHCTRILVLDGGRIVEDGTYDELIEKNGFFAELVERQRLDIAE